VVSVGWVDSCDCVCWVDFWEARRRVSVAFVCREERIVAAWSLRWDLREVTEREDVSEVIVSGEGVLTLCLEGGDLLVEL